MSRSSIFDQPIFNERLFFPRDDRSQAPAGAEDFFVPVSGAQLHIRLHKSPNARFTQLLFHGNGEVVSDYDGLAPRMESSGASLAVVDYRGYGRSTGTPTLRSAIEDALTVTQALLQRESGPLIVHGHSLGCVCAAEIAQNPPPGVGAIIWDSGFVRLAGLVARRGLEIPNEFQKDDIEVFASLPKLAKCKLPILVLHGAQDSQIPPEEAKEAWDAIPGTIKKLVLINGCDHNDVFMSPDYWKALSAFLRELAN